MRYGDLETPELRQAAQEEASNFQIDPALLEGREIITGHAIDADHSPDRDDAVSLTRENDQSVLHVSIADLTLIQPGSAMQAYARRRLNSTYKNNAVAVPMFPREISEDRLSLTDGQQRPVITFHLPIGADGKPQTPQITRDIMVAKAITPYEVEKLTVTKSDGGYFHECKLVAQALFKGRHPANESGLTLEDEEGHWLAISEGAVGQFIVQESMLATSGIAAAFMAEHNIPGLFRVHVPTFEEEERLKDYPELRKQFAVARYSIVPQEHLGLGVPRHTHITSPIRRYPDYVNLSNLMAFLDDREYPFDIEHLSHVVRRMERIEAQDRAQEAGRKTVGSGSSIAKREPSSTQARINAEAELHKIRNDLAHEGDLANALFADISGSDEEVATLRQTAADIIAKEPNMARSILQIVEAKGWVQIDADPLNSPTSKKLHLIATNRTGTSHPYSLRGKIIDDYLTMATTIGQLAGVPINPELPERMTREGRILRDPLTYLLKLNREKRGLRFGYHHTPDETTGETTLNASLHINGVTHKRTVTASTKDAAERQLGQDLIREFDLLENPPPKESKVPPKQDKSQRKETPVGNLVIHAARSRVTAPTYTNTTPEEKRNKDDGKECTLVFINRDGNPQTIVVQDTNYERAKQAAAKQALSFLPELPPKARKKKPKATPDPEETVET